MNMVRFDRISKVFAQRRLSRRQALAQGGAVLAAAGFASAGEASVAAQEATSDADAEHGPAMLFVQSFQGGSIALKEGVEGRYTVTLEHGLGQTIYFSDRPDRIVGAAPTEQFLEGLGFLPDNPPNAALVVENGSGETDIAVVELFDPVYDPAGPTVTYEVAVLENWEDSTELGFTAAPADLAAIAPTFGSAHLFIDDCPDLTIYCRHIEQFGVVDEIVGQFDDQGMCWNYSVCIPCEPYGHVQPDPCATFDYWKAKCNQQFAACKGKCIISSWWPFATDICNQ